MALDAELINLKSAGTYRFERDKSEISNDVATTISNLRLVVGFSKMGPFNTVKLVTSPAQFIKLYGNIDRSLEKRGSFFHRSALAALSAGPILCLNLLNLDPDVDQVVEKSFSVSVGDTNKPLVTLPLNVNQANVAPAIKATKKITPTIVPINFFLSKFIPPYLIIKYYHIK